MQRSTEPFIVTTAILAETDYMVATYVGYAVALRLIQSVAHAELQLESLTLADVVRAHDLMAQYADSKVGFVDASIVAIAERLGVTRILTLDRRHFGMIRPRHCEAFELLPELAEPPN